MKKWISVNSKKVSTMKFEFSPEQTTKYNTFVDQCKSELLAQQVAAYRGKDPINHAAWKARTCDWTMPYVGSIGGLVTVEFTQTTLGFVVKLVCKTLNKELDISDYDSW